MNDTLSPLVSIIICVYNGEKYLERCLQSAMSQSYKNIEIIVVNDGSMDNTPVIIENYVKLVHIAQYALEQRIHFKYSIPDICSNSMLSDSFLPPSSQKKKGATTTSA